MDGSNTNNQNKSNMIIKNTVNKPKLTGKQSNLIIPFNSSNNWTVLQIHINISQIKHKYLTFQCFYFGFITNYNNRIDNLW